jgi:hypothetical protein
LLLDTAMDLETDASKGLTRENSLMLERGTVPDNSVVKMAQTFRSGTNDIDCVHIPAQARPTEPNLPELRSGHGRQHESAEREPSFEREINGAALPRAAAVCPERQGCSLGSSSTLYPWGKDQGLKSINNHSNSADVPSPELCGAGFT